MKLYIGKRLGSYLKHVLVVILFLSFYSTLDSKHIIGGDMAYECIGIDVDQGLVTMRFTINMFRDKFDLQGTPSPFDLEAEIGIYSNRGGFWTYVQTELVDLLEQSDIAVEDSPCIEVPSNLDVAKGLYIFDVELPIINDSYLIVYQRCCRNNTISNIFSPESSGSAFTVEISPIAQQTCNSSPTFDNLPPIIICDGEPFEFDNGASDADGDQLIYEFVAPLSAGGPVLTTRNCDAAVPDPTRCLPPFPEVSYILPTYSANQPVPGDPPLSINPNTGIMSGVPTSNSLTGGGQYVVGVKVTEIDAAGVILGSIQRDFQFNVTTCNPAVNAVINAEAVIDAGPNKQYSVQSCGQSAINFLNESGDISFIDSTAYKWTFDIDGDIFTSAQRDVQVQFPGLGTYEGEMIVNNGLPCADTAFIDVNIYGSMEADFTSDYDTCSVGEVFFADDSMTDNEQLRDWSWDFGDGNTTMSQNPRHTFSEPGDYPVVLTVMDNEGCIDSITKVISYKPIPEDIVIQPSTFLGCTPANVVFTNLTELIDSTYDISWEFGDGNGSSEISPTHEYVDPGSYTVSVEIISEFGCGVAEDFTNFIRVENAPIADFDFDPKNPNSFNRDIQFVDQSIDAISWQWDFNGDGVAREPNPNYTFRDTGLHFIQLVVAHPSGCTDTIVKELDVIPLADYIMPNAFTPNGDGKNDVFKGLGNLDGVSNFNMTIWDRWGGQVYQSEDPIMGWNGQFENQGKTLPQGVYVYLVQYNDPRNRLKTLKGYATLIK